MTETELIKLCIENNRHAQRNLYNQYAHAMLGVCYRYTKSLADAEDILQEGFVKVFWNLKHFKQQSQLGAWVRKIMVNESINYLRRHSRYRNDLQLDKLPMHPVEDENPDVKLHTKDLIETIRQLPLGYQTVFNLIAIEGYNHLEVASLLEINEATSRSQYARARATLIKLLKEQENTAMPIRNAK